jgi:NTP pyrophosphatase (non-canonical NTP hydrolase)
MSADPIVAWVEDAIRREIDREAAEAQAKYGDFASMHEAYGVLAEEVDELFDAVKLGPKNLLRGSEIQKEAIQVAAVALRIAMQARRCKR